VDLAPTLLEWFGISPDRFPTHGHSLLPLARGEPAATREFIGLGDGPRQAIRTADFLLVGAPDGGPPHPGTATPQPSRLYVMPEDRWQVNDVAAQFPDEVDRLERQLNKFVISIQDTLP
jgi:arylsulfatase A-like enzyme